MHGGFDQPRRGGGGACMRGVEQWRRGKRVDEGRSWTEQVEVKMSGRPATGTARRRVVVASSPWFELCMHNNMMISDLDPVYACTERGVLTYPL